MGSSVLGKGLVRPWKCMVVVLGIIGEGLNLEELVCSPILGW